MSTDTNKATVRQFHDCFDRGDWKGIEAVVSKDVKSWNTGVEGVQDFTAFKAMGQGFMDGFSQSRMVIAEQVAEGDTVATRIHWSAIHSGTFNGIPPSNRPVQMEVNVFDRFAAGKIIEHRGLFDVLGLLTQIGAIPMPA